MFFYITADIWQKNLFDYTYLTTMNNINLKPLGDRVLVEPLGREELERKTLAGIVIPETAKEKPEQGKIIATGMGRKTEDGKIIPLSVKTGDKIIFAKYGPTEIKIGEKEYLIIKEEDILAIIE